MTCDPVYRFEFHIVFYLRLETCSLQLLPSLCGLSEKRFGGAFVIKISTTLNVSRETFRVIPD
jgi:hypothetical protein